MSQFNADADVSLDLSQGTLIGTGVGAVSFNLSAGSKSISETFATGTDARSYFTNDVIDLGALSTLIQDDTSINDTSVLNIDVSLSVDPTAPRSGLYVEMAAGVSCYMRGTRVLTDQGDVPVESLGIGDRVMTVSGEPKPIKWIGHRGVDCSRHPHPETVWPVRIQAHAFGEGWPNRDLFISPDHAVYIEGVFIPIKYLQNGKTVQQRPVGTVMYYHVELEAHDVVLAEGLPAKTFLDAGDRIAFANNDDGPVQLHPNFDPSGNDNYLLWESLAYAPLVIVGATVERALEHLRAQENVLRAREAVEHFVTNAAQRRPAVTAKQAV